MKLTLSSLLLKIFLWFWVTVIVTGISLVLTFMLEPRNVPSQWHATLEETARFSGKIAVETLEREGAPATSAYLDRLVHDTDLKACLFDASGAVVAGGSCETFWSMASHVASLNASEFAMKFEIGRAHV